jgi:phosphoglycolate phosphatase
LLNDAKLCSNIINGMLVSHGLQAISYEQYRERFDFPVKKYYERLGLSEKGVSFEQTSREFINNYQLLWKSCELHSQVNETLAVIQEQGIDQSIITAGERNLLRGFVKHHNLTDFFEDLIGVEDIYAAGKIEQAKAYAKARELKENEILMIGDTAHDHEVGRAIGAKVILFSKGHHPKKRLMGHDCPIIDCISEVCEFL